MSCCDKSDRNSSQLNFTSDKISLAILPLLEFLLHFYRKPLILLTIGTLIIIIK